MEILTSAALGGVAGLVFGAIGYFKRPNKEGFDAKKLASTVILTGAAGTYLGSQGILADSPAEMEVGLVFLTSIGIDQFIEKIVKVIWKKIKK